MREKRFYLFIQCTDNNGKIGSFLKNIYGKQVTPTFNNLVELLNSNSYRQIKEKYPIS